MGLLLGASLFVMPVASARAQIVPFEVANPNDPNGMYGGCAPGGNAGVERKSDKVRGHSDLATVVAISVIDCHQFDGPGGTSVVPCPPNTSFSYCLLTQNDGVGNHIELGVIVRKPDTQPPACRLAATRVGPPAQIDIAFLDQIDGISTIEFRGGVINAQTQPYAVFSDRFPIIITATKVNQTKTASLPNILVTDGAGNVTSCNFSF